MEKKSKLSFFITLLFLISTLNIIGQEAGSGSGNEIQNEKEHLEFSHPLITESISPDTKIRLTFLDTKADSNLLSQTYGLELEYSPLPVFSVHLDIPYTILHPSQSQTIRNLDEIELALKFANFAFSNHNILLGYGINFGLPTGNQDKGIGSNHILYINPFFNGGIKWKRWEWTAYFTFEMPCNQNENENIQTTMESRMTALYYISPRWQALLEAGSTSPISHFYKGDCNYDLTEGVKFMPDPDKPWILAIGVRHPVLNNNELKFQGIFSVFCHFKD